MLKRIFLAGLIGGCISGGFLLATSVFGRDSAMQGHEYGALFGYAAMLVALSVIFVAIKRQRDLAQGGVIKFLPAFGMGLAITAFAGVFYVIAWEITLAITGWDFATEYMNAMVEAKIADGMPEAEIEAYRAEMQGFADMYQNPVFRLPMTFIEILPVGVLVSLISAGLLRNSRFMPHKPVV
ncbi:MAG: DUF4199 domain-containing protein [Ponticaulis sp.]|nr:DUF4199 domain-containing protein [Ponticaulis sp.]|tara:strand:- start:70525 stop:71070 length:546 start_codon:yes stop_codon:yes gene_type:complete